MKVLVVHPGPSFSVADVHNGLVKGLKANGVEVGALGLGNRLDFFAQAEIRTKTGYVKALSDEQAIEMAARDIEVACYEFWPDVIVIVSGFFIPPKLWGILKRRPHHVVYWATESPYEDDRQGRPAQYADTVVLNDPTNLEMFRRDVNANTHYFPHSYDPDVHHAGPGKPEMQSDFAFIGTGFPSRIEWFERVDWSGIDARIGGNWTDLPESSPIYPLMFTDPSECMDNTQTADAYRSTKIGLNLYRKEHSEGAHADGWAMGPREVELAACGTFFFREPRPEGDELFPHLPLVTGPEEFGDLARWWLKHDDKRTELASAARAAIADRTFQNSAARLLGIVERAGRKIAA